jgi:lipopolysaccharide export system protein LptA
MSGKRRKPTRNNPSAVIGTARQILAALALLMAAAAPLAGAERFDFSSDNTAVTLSEGNQRALLTGHARVESKDLRITADQIELFGKDFIYAQCQGNVHVVDTKRGLDLTSQKLFYDRDKKIARVQGNAVMEDLDNEMTVKGGFIEDWDNEQITYIQVGVRIFKKDITCRSEFARYQRDTKILELSGMPWVSKAGDVYQAARITINLDTEEITLEGDVKGSIEQKNGDGSASDAASGDTAAGSGSGAASVTPAGGTGTGGSAVQGMHPEVPAPADPTGAGNGR